MAKSQHKRLKLDEIDYWSEIKLDIIRKYAHAYSSIFSAPKQSGLYHIYIDAFAGVGVLFSKTAGEEIEGSPAIAVNTQPPFREYHFIDLDGLKAENLRKMYGKRSDIHIHQGDCNQIMLEEVLPKVLFKDYRRGLCLLDPYGLHLDWEVIKTAGQMETIDLFLNFPITDMNRNVFWRNPEGVHQVDIDRMNRFWGGPSWRDVVYKKVPTLFDIEEEKTGNATIAEAFRKRLREVAGFRNVPKPMPMRKAKRSIVYYLFFASPKSVAGNIVTDIFNTYRNRGN